MVKPSGKGKYKVKVSAKVDGTTLPMGDMEFRVKRVPDPISTLDGSYGSGNMPAPRFKSTTGIVPKLENFEFPARFDIISYTIVAILPDGIIKYPCVGPRYDSKFKEMLDKGKFKKGCTVVFEDIVAKGPEGDRRQLSPIAVAITTN
jgi:hypothetical protein